MRSMRDFELPRLPIEPLGGLLKTNWGYSSPFSRKKNQQKISLKKWSKTKFSFQQTLVAYPMYTMVLSIASGAIYWGYAYLLLGFALFSISLYAAYASNQNYIRLITSSDRLIHIPCIIW